MLQGRSASASIRGYLYQSVKSAIEILTAPENASVTVEGPIEDIDIWDEAHQSSHIQCKYHESVNNYSASLLHKPILQAACAIAAKHHANGKHIIFAYFPRQQPRLEIVTPVDLRAAIGSTNQSLTHYTRSLQLREDIEQIASRIQIRFGPSLDDLIGDLLSHLAALQFGAVDELTFLLPNTIFFVQRMSAEADISKRRVRRTDLVSCLSDGQRLAITRVLAAHQGHDELLRQLRRRMSNGLNERLRRRALVITSKYLECNRDSVITLIDDMMSKYYARPRVNQLPLTVFVETARPRLDEIERDLHGRGMTVYSGIVGGEVNAERFRRPPWVQRIEGGEYKREFDVRLGDTRALQHFGAGLVIRDLFILGVGQQFELQNCNVYHLDLTTNAELRYTMGLANDWH